MISLFNNISSSNKGRLLRILESTNFTYQKSVNISYLFKDKNTIGFIASGSIDIIKIDYNGNKTIIDNLIEEDILGSSITNIINSDYEVITKEKTNLILFDYQVILKCSNNTFYYEQFIKNMLDILMEKNTEKNERLEILSEKTIRNKLLEYFRITSIKNTSKVIYLKSTFTSLADYLSIDRTAMSRELKHLKEEGFISIKGKKITLLY